MSTIPSPLPDASSTQRGAINTGTQSIKGTKTFIDKLALSNLAQGGATSGQLIIWNGTSWSPGVNDGSTEQIVGVEIGSADGQFHIEGANILASQQIFHTTSNITLNVTTGVPSIMADLGAQHPVRVLLACETSTVYTLTLTKDSGAGISTPVDTGLWFNSGTTVTMHPGDFIEFMLMSDGYYHEMWASITVTRA